MLHNDANCYWREGAESRWVESMRGRKELLAIALFCVINLLVPALFVELYPFTRVTMYSDSPTICYSYKIYDPQGNQLPDIEFGVQSDYDGNWPRVGFGFSLPTINRVGRPADQAAITDWIEKRLERFPSLSYVDVYKEIMGPIDNQRFGLIRREHWRIRNPHYRGS